MKVLALEKEIDGVKWAKSGNLFSQILLDY